MDHPPLSKRSQRSQSLDGSCCSDKNENGSSSSAGTTIPSLVFLCRTVVTINLERYTPESFRICDTYEWEEIIRLRHTMTQPQQNHHHHHNDSLDGNGRLLPAISEKVLLPIEECNEHLNDSVVADNLVWKDCVEYHFKRSVIRPPILFVPWPILVQQIQTQCGQILSSLIIMEDHNKDNNVKRNMNSSIVRLTNHTTLSPKHSQQLPTLEEIANAIHILQTTTWNIALLRDTGIGKIIKRILKQYQPQPQPPTLKRSSHNNTNTGSSSTTIRHMTESQIKILQQLLEGWMNLAKNNQPLTGGIYHWKEENEDTITTTSTTKSITASPLDKKRSMSHTTITTATDHHHHSSSSNPDMTMQQSQDLQLVEKCLSWRQLFQVLEHRKRHIQATQGQRMREIRNQVEMNRPKLVKVRPTAKATQLQKKVDPFSPVASNSSSSANNKMALLRNETSIQMGRLKTATKKPSFGDAVAFAAVTKKGMAHKRKVMGGTVLQFNNGTKRMKIPSSLSSTTGTTKACPSRQFASKYKSVPPIAPNSKKKK